MNTPFPPLRAGLLALATLATLVTAAAGRDGWATDFAAAKKQAAAEKKDLLLDFTGSDWCPYCIKLDQEVFQQELFKTTFKDKLVLVELDFPKKPENIAKQSDATKAQNGKLYDEFKIEGFPTIILCDATGKAYAQAGDQGGGPADYVAQLTALMEVRAKRDAAFAAAQQATDNLAKAKNLVAGLSVMAPEIVEVHYADVLARIGDLDKDDSTGFRKVLNEGVAKRAAVAEAGKQLDEFIKAKAGPLMQAGDFDKAYAEMREFLKATPNLPEDTKANVTLDFGLPRFVEKGDLDAATKFLDEVLAEFSKLEVAKHRDQILQKIKARIQQGQAQPNGAQTPAATKPG